MKTRVLNGKLFVAAESLHKELRPQTQLLPWAAAAVASTSARLNREFMRDDDGGFWVAIPLAQMICLRSINPAAMDLYEVLDNLCAPKVELAKKKPSATPSEVIARAEKALYEKARTTPEKKQEVQLQLPLGPISKKPHGNSHEAKRARLLRQVRGLVAHAVATTEHTFGSAWGVVKDTVREFGVEGDDVSAVGAIYCSGKELDIVNTISVKLTPPAVLSAQAAIAPN